MHGKPIEKPTTKMFAYHKELEDDENHF